MKKTQLTVLITFIFLQFSLAQELKDCKCEESYTNLVAKIEKEYPGFNTKVTDTLLYNNFKKSLLEESKNTSAEACRDLLMRYLGFFRDPHLFMLNRQSAQSPASQSGTPERSRKLEVDMKAFHQRIDNSTDALEGIWSSGSYKVGILKEEDTYNAFVIEANTPLWEPFEVKFTIFGKDSIVFYMQDHSPRHSTYTLKSDAIISINGIATWFIKQHPSHNLSTKQIKILENRLQGFYCEPVSDQTMLIRVSGFGQNAQAILENLIEQNRENIFSRDNLIIDLRDNRGGFSTAYAPLMPLVYTQPTRLPEVEFLVTQSMVDIFKSRLTAVEPEDYTVRELRLELILERIKPNIGKFMTMFETDQEVYIDDTYSPNERPGQIAILINNGCASAAEEFLFLARQSKKVKLLGTPTIGAIDYGSAMEFDFGCKGYTLLMPTFRSKRLPHYPLDNIGLQPDIFLDESITDWIEFAREFLEN